MGMGETGILWAPWVLHVDRYRACGRSVVSGIVLHEETKGQTGLYMMDRARRDVGEDSISTSLRRQLAGPLKCSLIMQNEQ